MSSEVSRWWLEETSPQTRGKSIDWTLKELMSFFFSFNTLSTFGLNLSLRLEKISLEFVQPQKKDSRQDLLCLTTLRHSYKQLKVKLHYWVIIFMQLFFSWYLSHSNENPFSGIKQEKVFCTTIQKFIHDYVQHPESEHLNAPPESEDLKLIIYFPKSLAKSIPPLHPQIIVEESLKRTLQHTKEPIQLDIQCTTMTFEFVDIEVCLYFYKLFKSYAPTNSIVSVGQEHSELYRFFHSYFNR